MSEAIETIKDFQKSDTKFQYMMLGRLKSDCEYFLGNGAGSTKHLYMQDVNDQIEVMKGLHNGLEVKPEWLTMEELLSLEERIKAAD
jgi:hypothetical protein